MALPIMVTGKFSQIQADYLDELAKKGYGAGRTEVVEYLIQRELDDLMRSSVLQHK